MKLKPLEQFICDSCRKKIEKIEDGWLEWQHEPRGPDKQEKPLHGFRIVHHSSASPRKEEDNYCYYPEGPSVSDLHLRYFTGVDGLAMLLSFFDRNLADPGELAEIIRRLHIPRYEEARPFLDRAIKDAIVDGRDCTQNDLGKIIKRYVEAS